MVEFGGHMKKKTLFLLMVIMVWRCWGEEEEDNGVILDPSELEMFVDPLPDIPRINVSSVLPRPLRIGMYAKYWKFHRDLPRTRVFAYGTSKGKATVPGPTIDAYYGIPISITWTNHLPSRHILPWDPSIPTAKPPSGVPTVVHLHGGIHQSVYDGYASSWFTSSFRHRGPTWSSPTYSYSNFQHPGTLWYHDHAMGLTRVNLLAGLVGAYVLHQPSVESLLGLPYAHPEYDRPLVVFDRSFAKDGSIYMNATGNNPSIHPQWQPEYFGDAIIVNGKAWPHLVVRRRRYRFRIINASNARFFKFYFENGLEFILVGSDSSYNPRPMVVKDFLLAPSEIADVIIDFSKLKSGSSSAILRNSANYPYPSGDPVNKANSHVMKFIIKGGHQLDDTRIPSKLIQYPAPDASPVSETRYITLFEYVSDIDEPTHMYINGMPFEAPATETPKVGTTEVWYVINLTEDNHPLHIHLGLFVAMEQVELLEFEKFNECMVKKNDAKKCKVEEHARGKRVPVDKHEKGWKNVYKMMPHYMTKMVVRFSYIHSNSSYRFDATAEPGYVYHCHILDHEDNVMMRPLKLIN